MTNFWFLMLVVTEIKHDELTNWLWQVVQRSRHSYKPTQLKYLSNVESVKNNFLFVLFVAKFFVVL